MLPSAEMISLQDTCSLCELFFFLVPQLLVDFFPQQRLCPKQTSSLHLSAQGKYVYMHTHIYIYMWIYIYIYTCMCIIYIKVYTYTFMCMYIYILSIKVCYFIVHKNQLKEVAFVTGRARASWNVAMDMSPSLEIRVPQRNPKTREKNFFWFLQFQTFVQIFHHINGNFKNIKPSDLPFLHIEG